MKLLCSLLIAGIVGLSLSGCVSARLEQNPQPRGSVPYKVWEKAAKTEPATPAAAKAEDARQTKKAGKKSAAASTRDQKKRLPQGKLKLF